MFLAEKFASLSQPVRMEVKTTTYGVFSRAWPLPHTFPLVTDWLTKFTCVVIGRSKLHWFWSYKKSDSTAMA